MYLPREAQYRARELPRLVCAIYIILSIFAQ